MPRDYDTRGINWARLAERVLAGLINTVTYGTVLIVAHLLGII